MAGGAAETAAPPLARPADIGHRPAVAAVTSLFPWRCHYHRHYSRAKLLTDPLYRAIWEQLRPVPPMTLIDLGCGLGLNGLYLRQRGWTGGYLGIDFDQRKIDLGQRLVERGGADRDHFNLRVGDLRQYEPDSCGHVALLDVLQYFTPGQQQQLVRRVAAAVAPGGLLLIRATLSRPGLRFRINQACDWFARGVNWMRSQPVHYASGDELTEWLGACGLQGEFRPLWGRTPFCNWLGVFSRPD